MSHINTHSTTKNTFITKERKLALILAVVSTLLITSTFVGVVTVDATVVDDNVYFVYETFDNMDQNSLWNGKFSQDAGKAIMKSNYASAEISMAFWDGTSPIYLKLDASSGAKLTVFAKTGEVLLKHGVTGSEVVDVTEAFIGYRTILYKSPLAAEAASEKSIVLRLEGKGETFDHLELYSDVKYSLSGDTQFGMDLAITDRNYQGTNLGDKPIYIGPNQRMWASQLSPNARAFKIFDSGSDSYSDLLGQDAVNIAGSEYEIPSSPSTSVEYLVALSSDLKIPSDMSVMFRLHFLTAGHVVPTTGSAITEWEVMYNSIQDGSADITHLEGFTGRFTIEVKVNKVYTGDSNPNYPIYFILGDMTVNTQVNDAPKSMGTEINAATDFAYLGNGAQVAETVDGQVLTSDVAGEMAYYMLDASSAHSQMDFAGGQFYRYFAHDSSVGSGSIQYSTVNDSVRINTGFDTKIEYIADVEELDFWSRNYYAFIVDMNAINGKMSGGIGLGSESYQKYVGYELEFDRNLSPTQEGYDPSLIVNMYSYDGAGTLSKSEEANYPVEAVSTELQYDKKMSLIVVHDEINMRANVYVVQDDNVNFIASHDVSNIWYSDIDEFNLIGDTVEMSRSDISLVEDKLIDTLYIKAANPSPNDITLDLIKTTPGPVGAQAISIGSITVPADSDMREYPITINTDWGFIERIMLNKTGNGDTLNIKSLMVEGVSQPGFTRSLTRYTNPGRTNPLGSGIEVMEDHLLQTSRAVTDFSYDPYYDLVMEMDASFEETLSGYSTTGSGMVEQINADNRYRVQDGTSSLRISADSNSEFTFTKNIDLTDDVGGIVYEQLEYSIIMNGLETSTDGTSADYVEVYLSHPEHGYIPAFGNDITRRTVFRPVVFDGSTSTNTLDAQVVSTIGTVNQDAISNNIWMRPSIDISSLTSLSNPQDWEFNVRVVSEVSTSSPLVYLDDFRVDTTAIDPFIASIPAFLPSGPNKINIRGMVDSRETEFGVTYPTLKIGIKHEGDTEFQMMGDSFQLKGINGTKVTNGMAFDVPISGVYDVGVFYDETVQQSKQIFQLYDMIHEDVPSVVGAEQLSSAASQYEGLEAQFGGLGNDLLGGRSMFNEDISYRRGLFDQVWGSRIAGLHTYRGVDKDDLYYENKLDAPVSNPDSYYITNSASSSSWSVPNNADAVHSQGRYFMTPSTTSGSDLVYTESIHKLPAMDTDWDLFISEIGWNFKPHDVAYGYIVLYDENGQRIKMGVQDPNPEASIFEYLETDLGTDQTQEVYPELLETDRFINLQRSQDNLQLTAYFDDRFVTQELEAFNPTRIGIQFQYVPDKITVGSSIEDTTSFSVGKIRMLSDADGLQQYEDFEANGFNYVKQYKFDDIDDITGWSGYPIMDIELLSNSKVGTSSIGGSYPSYNDNFAVISSSGVDFGDYSAIISEKDYSDTSISFWLYLSDVSEVDVENLYFELGTSVDFEELEWSGADFDFQNLKDGWNKIIMPFDDASQNGQVDWSSVTHSRLLVRGTGINANFEIAIDGLGFLKKINNQGQNNLLHSTVASGNSVGNDDSTGRWTVDSNSTSITVSSETGEGYALSDGIRIIHTGGESASVSYRYNGLDTTELGEYYKLQYKYRVVSGTAPTIYDVMYQDGWQIPDAQGNDQVYSNSITLEDGWVQVETLYSVSYAGDPFLRLGTSAQSAGYEIIFDDLFFGKMDYDYSTTSDKGLEFQQELSDYIRLPSSTYQSVQDYTQRFKYEMNTLQASGNNVLFSGIDDSDQDAMLVIHSSSSIEIWENGVSLSFDHLNSYTAGSEYDLVITRNNATYAVYLNGNKLNQTDSNGTNSTISVSNAVLGLDQDCWDSFTGDMCASDTSSLLGSMYEYRFYNQGMLASDITALYGEDLASKTNQTFTYISGNQNGPDYIYDDTSYSVLPQGYVSSIPILTHEASGAPAVSEMTVGAAPVTDNTRYEVSVWFYMTPDTDVAPVIREYYSGGNTETSGSQFSYQGSTDTSTWPTDQWIPISASYTTTDSNLPSQYIKISSELTSSNTHYSYWNPVVREIGKSTNGRHTYFSEGSGEIDISSTIDQTSGLAVRAYNTTGLAAGSYEGDIIDQFTMTSMDISSYTLPQSDYLSLIMKGTIRAEFTETYTFFATVDEGVRVWIEGEVVIDAWNNQGLTTLNGSIDLDAGESYDIYIESYQTTGSHTFQLEWSSASQPREIISSPDIGSVMDSSAFEYLELDLSHIVGNWNLDIVTATQTISVDVYEGINRFNLGAATGGEVILALKLSSNTTMSQVTLDDINLYTIANAKITFGQDADINSVVYNVAGSLVAEMNSGSDFDTRITYDISDWDMYTFPYFEFSGDLNGVIVDLLHDGSLIATLQNDIDRGNLLQYSGAMSDVSFELSGSGSGGIASLNHYGIYTIPGVSLSTAQLGGVSPILSNLDDIYADNGNLMIQSNSGSTLLVEFENFVADGARFGEFISTQNGVGTHLMRVLIDSVFYDFDNSRSIDYRDKRRSFEYSVTDGPISQSAWIQVNGDVTVNVDEFKLYNLPDFNIPDNIGVNQVLYLDAIENTVSVYDNFLKRSIGISDFGMYLNPFNPSIYMNDILDVGLQGHIIEDFSNGLGHISVPDNSVTTSTGSITLARGSDSDDGYGHFELGISANSIHGNYLVVNVRANFATNGKAWLSEIGHLSGSAGGVDNVFWKAYPEQYSLSSTWNTFVIDLGTSPLDVGPKWTDGGGLHVTFDDGGMNNKANSIEVDYLMVGRSSDAAPDYEENSVLNNWDPGTGTSESEFNGFARYEVSGQSSSISAVPNNKLASSIENKISQMRIYIDGEVSSSNYIFGVEQDSTFFDLGTLYNGLNIFTYEYITGSDEPSIVLKTNDGSDLPVDTGFELVKVEYIENTLDWTVSEIATDWLPAFGTTSTDFGTFVRYNGSAELATPGIVSNLAPSLVRDRNKIKIDMSTSTDLIGYHLQIFDNNNDNPIYAIDAGEITSAARQTYTIDLSTHSFQTFPEIRFVDPSGTRTGSLSVDIYGIEMVRDHMYSEYDNIESISKDNGRLIINPIDSTDSVSLMELDLSNLESYKGLYIDMERLGSATANHTLDFTITVYDIFDNEYNIILDHFNSTKYQTLLADGERKQIYIPFVDDLMGKADKLILSVQDLTGAFSTDTFKFYTITAINTKANFYNLGTYTGVDSGDLEMSSSYPFATMASDVTGMDGSSALRLRTYGNESLAGIEKSITPGVYKLSFWVKALSYADQEVLDILTYGGSKNTFSVDLSTADGYWRYISKTVNITQDVAERDIKSSMIFRLGKNATGMDVGDNISQTVIYLDDVMLYRIDSKDIVDEDGLDIGSENSLLTDTIIVPGANGAILEVEGLPSRVAIEFVVGGDVEFVKADGSRVTLMSNWSPEVAYKINVIGQFNEIKAGVWMAAAPRTSGGALVSTQVSISGQISLRLYSYSQVTDGDYPVRIKSDVVAMSDYTGVIGFGQYEINFNSIRHYDSSEDGQLYLADENGNKLLVADFAMELDYILENGEMIVNIPGTSIELTSTAYIINGVSMPIKSGYEGASGTLRVERYDGKIFAYKDSVLVGQIDQPTAAIGEIFVSGFGEYEFANVTVEYSEDVRYGASTVVMDGPSFTIAMQESDDISRASRFVVHSSGPIEFGTVESGFAPETVNGYEELDIDALRNSITTETKVMHLELTNIAERVRFHGYSYSSYGYPLNFVSEIVGDQRLDTSDNLVTADYSVTNYDTNDVISLKALTPSGDTGGDVDYVWYGQDNSVGFTDGIYEYTLGRDKLSPSIVERETFLSSLDWVVEGDNWFHYYDMLDFISYTGGEFKYVIVLAEDDQGYRDALEFNIEMNIDPIPGEEDEYEVYTKIELNMISAGVTERSWKIIRHNDVPNISTIYGIEWYSDNTNEFDPRPLLESEFNSLQIYRDSGEYSLFIDGVPFTRGTHYNCSTAEPSCTDEDMATWTVGIQDGGKVGIGISDGIYLTKMQIREASYGIPSGTITSDDRSTSMFDNSMNVRGYQDVDGKLTQGKFSTATSYFVDDISVFSTEIQLDNLQANGKIYVETDSDSGNDRRIGIQFYRELIDNGWYPDYYVTHIQYIDETYSDGTWTNVGTEYTTLNSTSIGNSYRMEIKFSHVGPGNVEPQILFYDTTKQRTNADRYDLSGSISIDDKLTFHAVTNHTLNLLSMNLNTIDINTETNEAGPDRTYIEASGDFPQYTIAGPESYSAVFTDGNQVRREFAISQMNDTSIFSIDINVDKLLSGTASFTYDIVKVNSPDENIVSFRVDRNGIWVKPETGSYNKISDYFLSSITTLSVEYQKDDASIVVSVQARGIDVETEYSLTPSEVLEVGDLAAVDLSFTGDVSDYIFVDNLKVPGYEVDGFSSGSVEEVKYEVYSVFDVELTKRDDLGPRYIAVEVRSLNAYTELSMSINDVELETKILRHDGRGTAFQSVVFYIPTSVDTQGLMQVSLKSSDVVHMTSIGLFQEQTTDEVLVTGNSIYGENSFEKIIRDIGDVNADTGNWDFGATNYALSTEGSTIEIGSNTASMYNPSSPSEINRNKIGLELVRNQTNTGDGTGSNTIFAIDSDTNSSRAREHDGTILVYDTGSTSDSSPVDHVIIVRVMVVVGENGGVGNPVLMPVYLIFEVGSSNSLGSTPDFGISNMVSYGDRMGSDLILSTIHKAGSAQMYETYGWMIFDHNTGDEVAIRGPEATNNVVIDLNHYLSIYNAKVANMGSSAYWDQDLINTIDSNDDFEVGEVNPVQDGDYQSRFYGIAGMAWFQSDSSYFIDNVGLIDSPVLDDFAPAEGRLSSYMGLNEGYTWNNVPVGNRGDVVLDRDLSYSKSLSSVGLLTYTISSPKDAYAKMRIRTNLPAVIYADDQVVGTLTEVRNGTDIEEKLIDFEIKGGGYTDIFVVLYHPGDEHDSTRELSNVQGKDHWRFGFSVVSDVGLEYGLSSAQSSGMSGDYVQSFTTTRNLYDLPNANFADEMRKYHSIIPLPGEDYNLDFDPDQKSRVEKAQADTGTSDVPMIDLMDVGAGRIDWEGSSKLDGTGLMMSNVLLTDDMTSTKLTLRFIAKDTRSFRAITINEFMITTSSYTGTDLSSDYRIYHVGTGADITQGTLSDPVEDIDIRQHPDVADLNMVEVVMSLSEGVHTISMAVQNSDNLNATDAYGERKYAVGLEVASATGSPGSWTYEKLPDNMRAINEPVMYDPMNYLDSKIKTIQLDVSDDIDSGARYAPLARQTEGVSIMQSSWFMTADGAYHLKREERIGFKEIGGCSTSSEKTGLLYTKTTLDPGTPQESGVLAEQYVSTQADDTFDTPLQAYQNVPQNPDGNLATVEHERLFDAVDIYQTPDENINQRYDTFSIDGISLELTNDGYRLAVQDIADFNAYNNIGQQIALNQSTEFTAEMLNSEGKLIIPNYQGGLNSVVDTDLTLSSALISPHTKGDTDIHHIEFETNSGDLGILYVGANILDIITASGFEVNYRLVSGNVRVHEIGTGMAANFHGTRVSYFFDLDFFAADRVAEHFTAGAMNNSVQAFSMAKLALLRDPNFEKIWIQTVQDQTTAAMQQSIDNTRSAISSFVQETSNGEGGFFSSVSSTVNNLREDPIGFVQETVESYNGQINRLVADSIGSVGDWVLNTLEAGLTFACNVAFNILAGGVNLLVSSWNSLKSWFMDIFMGAIEDLLAAVKDKFSEILAGLERLIMREPNMDYEQFAQDVYSEVSSEEWEENELPIFQSHRITSIYESAVALGASGPLLEVVKYLEMVKKARMRFMFLAAWGLVMGSAIGFQYELSDLFPNVEDYQSWADDAKIDESYISSKLVGAQLLQIDKPVSWMGAEMKHDTMVTISNMMGWNLGYDPTPIGEAPSADVFNFNNFDVIARISEDGKSWKYFLGLSDSLKVPIPLFSFVPGSVATAALSGILGFMGDLLKDSGLDDDMINSITSGEKPEGLQNSLTGTGLGDKIFHIMNIIPALNGIGLVFSLGADDIGIQGLDPLFQAAGLGQDGQFGICVTKVVGNGCSEDDAAYKSDAYGRETQEKKWSLNLGVTEKFFIGVIEFVSNFGPMGAIMGAFQDLRDAFFGDTLLDRVFGLVFLVPSLGEIGAHSVTTEAAEKAKTQVAERSIKKGDELYEKAFLQELDKLRANGEKVDVLKDGQVKQLSKFPVFNQLISLSKRINRFGGGGAHGFIRSALWPLFVVKRALFGSWATATKGVVTQNADRMYKQALEGVTESFQKQADEVYQRALREAPDDVSDDAARASAELQRQEYLLSIDDDLAEFATENAQRRYREVFEEYVQKIIRRQEDAYRRVGGMNVLAKIDGKDVTDPKVVDQIISDLGASAAIKDIDSAYRQAADEAGQEVFGPMYKNFIPKKQGFKTMLKAVFSYGLQMRVLNKGLLMLQLPIIIKRIATGMVEFVNKLRGPRAPLITDPDTVGEIRVVQAYADSRRNGWSLLTELSDDATVNQKEIVTSIDERYFNEIQRYKERNPEICDLGSLNVQLDNTCDLSKIPKNEVTLNIHFEHIKQFEFFKKYFKNIPIIEDGRITRKSLVEAFMALTSRNGGRIFTSREGAELVTDRIIDDLAQLSKEMSAALVLGRRAGDRISALGFKAQMIIMREYWRVAESSLRTGLLFNELIDELIPHSGIKKELKQLFNKFYSDDSIPVSQRRSIAGLVNLIIDDASPRLIRSINLANKLRSIITDTEIILNMFNKLDYRLSNAGLSKLNRMKNQVDTISYDIQKSLNDEIDFLLKNPNTDIDFRADPLDIMWEEGLYETFAEAKALVNDFNTAVREIRELATDDSQLLLSQRWENYAVTWKATNVGYDTVVVFRDRSSSIFSDGLYVKLGETKTSRSGDNIFPMNELLKDFPSNSGRYSKRLALSPRDRLVKGTENDNLLNDIINQLHASDHVLSKAEYQRLNEMLGGTGRLMDVNGNEIMDRMDVARTLNMDRAIAEDPKIHSANIAVGLNRLTSNYEEVTVVRIHDSEAFAFQRWKNNQLMHANDQKELKKLENRINSKLGLKGDNRLTLNDVKDDYTYIPTSFSRDTSLAKKVSYHDEFTNNGFASSRFSRPNPGSQSVIDENIMASGYVVNPKLVDDSATAIEIFSSMDSLEIVARRINELSDPLKSVQDIVDLNTAISDAFYANGLDRVKLFSEDPSEFQSTVKLINRILTDLRDGHVPLIAIDGVKSSLNRGTHVWSSLIKPADNGVQIPLGFDSSTGEFFFGKKSFEDLAQFENFNLNKDYIFEHFINNDVLDVEADYSLYGETGVVDVDQQSARDMLRSSIERVTTIWHSGNGLSIQNNLDKYDWDNARSIQNTIDGSGSENAIDEAIELTVYYVEKAEKDWWYHSDRAKWKRKLVDYVKDRATDINVRYFDGEGNVDEIGQRILDGATKRLHTVGDTIGSNEVRTNNLTGEISYGSDLVVEETMLNMTEYANLKDTMIKNSKYYQMQSNGLSDLIPAYAMYDFLDKYYNQIISRTHDLWGDGELQNVTLSDGSTTTVYNYNFQYIDVILSNNWQYIYIEDGQNFKQVPILNGDKIHNTVGDILQSVVSQDIFEVGDIEKFVMDLLMINYLKMAISVNQISLNMRPSFFIKQFMSMPIFAQKIIMETYKENSYKESAENLIVDLKDGDGSKISIYDLYSNEKGVLISEAFESFMNHRVVAGVNQLMNKKIFDQGKKVIHESIDQYFSGRILHQNMLTNKYSHILDGDDANKRLSSILSGDKSLLTDIGIGSSNLLTIDHRFSDQYLVIDSQADVSKILFTGLFQNKVSLENSDVISSLHSLSLEMNELYSIYPHSQPGFNLFSGRRLLLKLPPPFMTMVISILNKPIFSGNDWLFDKFLTYFELSTVI